MEDYTKEMKIDRAGMLEHLIGTGKRIKQADDDIAKYKMKIIEEIKNRESILRLFNIKNPYRIVLNG